jgi:peptidoglycan/LPS O-acetylase OafA/YrhL
MPNTPQTTRPVRDLTKQMTIPPPPERKAGLDLLRAVAILLVVFHHGHTLFLIPFMPPLPDGVDLFFVLSGYLIGGILIKGIARSEGFTMAALRVFWFRRWFRTLPAYGFVLLLNAGILWVELTRNHTIRASIKQVVLIDKLWTYCFFVQNLFTNLTSGFFPESWSLSVEEWFYLLIPLLLLFFLRLKLPVQRAILWAVLILIVVPTCLRFIAPNNELQTGWMTTRMVVVMRLDAIGFGVLMAYIGYYKPALWKQMAGSFLFLLGGLTLCYGGFLFIYGGYNYFNSVALTNVFFFTLTSIGAMLMLPALSHWQPRSRLLVKIITHISLISYSMYLLNQSVIVGLIQHVMPADASQSTRFIAYLVYWACTIGGSTLMYHYIEQPFMRFRDIHFGSIPAKASLTI